MAAIYCPVKTSKDYLEMVDVFKDTAYVHKLWNDNKGNSLDKDHKGNASILFEDLMEFTNGDREASMKYKSTVFNESFFNFFGKWNEQDYKPETHDVYENGEPFMDTFLNYSYVEDQTKIHPDLIIRADIRKYGEEEITDLNNSYVWDVENEYGLVDKERWRKDPNKKWKTKKLQGFPFNKALKIIKELNDNGISAFPVDVHYPGTDLKSKTGVQVRVDISRPVNKKASKDVLFNKQQLTEILLEEVPEELRYTLRKDFLSDDKDVFNDMALQAGYNRLGAYWTPSTVTKRAGRFKNGTGLITIAGQTFNVRYADTTPIRDHIGQVESGNSFGTMTAPKFLRFLYDAHRGLIERSPELVGSIQLILGNRNKFDNLKIQVKPRSSDGATYMEYDSESHSIIMYTSDILEEPTMEGFISTMVHEMGHALVYDAIENPENEIDQQLKKSMTEVWSAYKKQKNRTNENAAQDVHEFVANFFTDSRLRNQLKEMREPSFEKSLYQRVVDAIIDWFKRMSGYKLRKEHEGNMNTFVENSLNTFINKKTEIRNVIRDINAVKKAKVKNSFLEDIQSHVNEEQPETIKTALKAFGALFEKDATEHTYKLKADRTISFKSVTQINSEHGYGITEESKSKLSEDRLSALTEGGKLGTAVHMTAEEVITDVVKDIMGETGYSVSDDAKAKVKEIVDNIRRTKTVNGVKPIIMSEVTVADISKGIAGTIDLVVIDGLGRVHIYDFKTHKKGFNYYQSTKYGKSQQASYQLQLSAYKLLLEEVLDGKVRVSTMNIVQLVPIIDEKTKNIMTLSLDTSIFADGIDRFSITPLSLQNIYGTGRGYSWDSVSQKASLDADVLSTPRYKLEQIETGKLTTLDDVYRKTMKMLDSKVQIMRRRYSFTKRRSFEEHFNLVSQIESSSLAIIQIIKYAAKTTNQLVARYNEMDKDNMIFTSSLLQEWRDYITAYESLDSLQSLLDTNPALLNDPEIKGVLDQVIKNKNIIKSVYTLKGKEAVAKKLVPYFDMIKVQRKEELESFWRRMDYRVSKGVAFKKGEKIGGKFVEGTMSREEFEQYGKTMQEFVDYHLSKEKSDIDKATYELLLKELSVASNDVNEAIRWVDALADTTDPIAAAIVSAFSKADEASRMEALDKKIEFYNTLTELEKERHKTGMTSERKFYDEILDVSDLGSYLIRPFLSSLEAAEREVRSLHKMDESGAAIGAWIKEQFPLSDHEEAYLDAFHAYLISQYKEGNLTVAEVNALIENETNPNKHFPITALTKPKEDERGNEYEATEIRSEAGDIAINWKSKNRKLYSTIDKRWHNSKWDVFMNRLGISTTIAIKEQYDAIAKSNDPMAKMYTLLVQTAEEADAGIPYSHRLGYRLPGIYKNMNESIRSGDTLATTFKEKLQFDFIRREGDIEYNPQEYTDEAGNPKYFLPVHYINKLAEDKQSFDLPTIYFKFWDSANDYANKQDILPTIEMAKHFVETRFTEKRDSMGKKILRSIRSSVAGAEEETAVTRNSALAAQLNDWFQMYVYGNTVEKSQLKISDNLTLDVQKFVDGINRYTSINLLALNVVQSFANVAIGESMQGIEAIAGEYMTKTSYTKASRLYAKWLPDMLNDVGKRIPTSLGSLLIQEFNAMNEDQVGETEFANKNKLKALSKQQAFAFMQNGGEHLLRTRFLIGSIDHDIRAINSEGKDIGSMIDYYYVKNGKLAIKEEVNLVKSKWTQEDRQRWARTFRGRADTVHGAYSQEARVAAQRYFIGKLAYMFRKFVMPGIRRRYGREAYSERLHQTREGNYVTTYKFFKKLRKEMIGMQFALIGEEWASLSPHQQANIKRTISEMAMLTSVMILSGFAYSHWTDGEDESDKRFWAFLAYQSLRLKTEMLFYISLGNAMQILRSPMASMSVLENIGKTWDQMFNPLERYERGPWKGRLKLERDIVQFIPVYKQYFKMRDVEEQIPWFR